MSADDQDIPTGGPQAAPRLEAGEAETASTATPRVVGIGASAGGLEALERFFDNVPSNTGLAYVVVQHLSPDYKSMMVELLSKHTLMKVNRVDDGVAVEPDTVYLIPPRKHLTIHGGRLELLDKPPGHVVSLPIDIFFRSLAEDQGDRSVGVVLSGTGSDGARGVRAIKEVGGLVLVQDEHSARFDGMPRAAISTGAVDFVATPEQMPEMLLEYLRRRELVTFAPDDVAESDGPPVLVADPDHLGVVLELLRKQCGVDFRRYKRATVLRRIERRMAITQVTSFEDYVKLLRASSREITSLHRELLINVTRFFRDQEAFEQLARETLPAIISDTPQSEAIRVWVPGCSTGEEAYTLAMLLDEQLEALGAQREFKVFATDVDREALEVASAGVYPDGIATDLTPERLHRFFSQQPEGFRVVRNLRNRVVFAHHNLGKDPPFTRVALVSCRNLLIYFEPELQRQVLSHFLFALRPGGFLFLGASESLGELATEFSTRSSRWKIFQTTGRRTRTISDALPPPSPGGRRRPLQIFGERPRGDERAVLADRVRDELMSNFVPPALLITESHELLHTYGDVSKILKVPPGAASLNVIPMLPRAVGSILALAAHRAVRDGREVVYHRVPLREEAQGYVTMRVRPIDEAETGRRYLLVALPQATGLVTDAPASEVSADADQRIADLTQDLQYTRESLQATIEELETANEELQATNEELQATNEELVASNEELQSTNEELQSVNEELFTVNAEYQQKIEELVDVNADLDNVLEGAAAGSLFLDDKLNIRKATPGLRAIINVLPRDVGRPVDHLTFNFPAEGLGAELEQVRNDQITVEREVRLRDGRTYVMRIRPYTRTETRRNGVVMAFVEVTALKRAQERLQRCIDALPEQLAVIDRQGVITLVNDAWRSFAADNAGPLGEKSFLGANYLAVCRHAAGDEDESARQAAAGIESVLSGQVQRFSMEYPCHSPTVKRWFLMFVAPIRDEIGGATVSHVDVTRRKLIELELEARQGPRQ